MQQSKQGVCFLPEQSFSRAELEQCLAFDAHTKVSSMRVFIYCMF
jgi:hypothetical protein